MKFSMKDFSSKCDQIRRKLRIWSHLLKKSLMENLIFCAVGKTLLKNRNWTFPAVLFTWKNVSNKLLIYDCRKINSLFKHIAFFQRNFNSQEDEAPKSSKTINRSTLPWNKRYEIIVKIQHWFYTLRSGKDNNNVMKFWDNSKCKWDKGTAILEKIEFWFWIKEHRL